MKIELVYFEGCPNAEAARKNLRKACSELGLANDWKEWDQEDDSTPQHLKAFGSPSILVEGKDVAGATGNGSEQSCRLYEGSHNAPDVETIRTAIQENLTP